MWTWVPRIWSQTMPMTSFNLWKGVQLKGPFLWNKSHLVCILFFNFVIPDNQSAIVLDRYGSCLKYQVNMILTEWIVPVKQESSKHIFVSSKPLRYELHITKHIELAWWSAFTILVLSYWNSIFFKTYPLNFVSVDMYPTFTNRIW